MLVVTVPTSSLPTPASPVTRKGVPLHVLLRAVLVSGFALSFACLLVPDARTLGDGARARERRGNPSSAGLEPPRRTGRVGTLENDDVLAVVAASVATTTTDSSSARSRAAMGSHTAMYSIWLEPPAGSPMATKSAAFIKSQAARMSGSVPVFSPHVTLAGGFQGEGVRTGRITSHHEKKGVEKGNTSTKYRKKEKTNPRAGVDALKMVSKVLGQCCVSTSLLSRPTVRFSHAHVPVARLRTSHPVGEATSRELRDHTVCQCEDEKRKKCGDVGPHCKAPRMTFETRRASWPRSWARQTDPSSGQGGGWQSCRAHVFYHVFSLTSARPDSTFGDVNASQTLRLHTSPATLHMRKKNKTGENKL